MTDKKLSEDKSASFWLKVAGGVLTAGFGFMITMSYKTTERLAVIQTDVTYVRETLRNFDTRLTRLENSAFIARDAEQLKSWTELKLEAVKVQVKHNRNKIEDVKMLVESNRSKNNE